MILRTLLILGFGAAQPAGLPAMVVWAAPQDDASIAEPQSREELGREFAAWRADLLTRGEGAEAMVALGSLVSRAEGMVREQPSDRSGVALLADLYRAEFEQSERRLGLAALRELFLARLKAAYPPAGSDAAGLAIAEASAAVVTSARIESLLHTAVQEATVAGTDSNTLEVRRRTGPQAQMLAAAVADAVDAGDEAFIRQLGAEAVAPLKSLASVLSGERAVEPALDPLRLLASLDPQAALDVAVIQCSTQDLLLKLRVVEAFRRRGPFLEDVVWQPAASGGHELVDPEWATIVESLYTDPVVPAPLADEFLAPFVKRGHLPGELVRLVPDFLVRRPLAEGALHSSVEEAARELLGREDAAERAAGVRVILRTASVVPLYGLAGSVDPKVRGLLAQAFGPRPVGREVVQPKIDEAYREALRTFLLVDAGEANAQASYDEIAAALRSSAEVSLESGTAAIDASVVASLVERDRSLTAAAMRGLTAHLPTMEETDRAVAVESMAKALLDDPVDSTIQALLAAAAETDSAEPMIAVWEDSAGADAWRALVEAKREPSGLTVFSTELVRLPIELQLRTLRALWRVGYDNFERLDEDEVSLQREHWLELVSETALPLEARSWALEALSDAKGSLRPERAERTIAEAVAAIGDCPIAAREMTAMGLEPERYLRELLAVPGVPDSALLAIWVPLEDGALVDELLERFPPATWREHSSSPLLSGVISALAGRRDVRWNGALAEANVPRSAIQSYLIQALHFERFEGHLPLGGALLKAGANDLETVIDYVASFATDEAARYLVEAMETARSEFVREKFFEALRKMTERREAADRWRRSRDAAERRDAAVAQLVETLEDPASGDLAVIESIRGLGLLDAREELPRLIELLGSTDEARRAAARDAIDRLGK